jgi:hypothetical protein
MVRSHTKFELGSTIHPTNQERPGNGADTSVIHPCDCQPRPRLEENLLLFFY